MPSIVEEEDREVDALRPSILNADEFADSYPSANLGLEKLGIRSDDGCLHEGAQGHNACLGGEKKVSLDFDSCACAGSGGITFSGLSQKDSHIEKKAGVIISQEGPDEYLLGGRLGSGGFGTVYRATRIRDGQKVAVKCQHESNVSWFRDLGHVVNQELEALDEVRNSGGCDYVIKLLDTGYKSRLENPEISHLCFVLEFCDMDLNTFVFQHNTPAAVRTVWCYQLAAALAFIHTRRYCHGDLKLNNILVSLEQAVLKLTDFGLSRSFPSDAGSSALLDDSARRTRLAEREAILYPDIQKYAELVMELWLDRTTVLSYCLCGDVTVNTVKEKAKTFGPIRGKAFKKVAMALGFTSSGDRDLRECREYVATLSEVSGVPLDIRDLGREFLMWCAAHPKTGSGRCGIKIPEVIVNSCLMSCHQFEENEEISAQNIAEKLEGVIPKETFEECKEFFLRLPR